MPLRADAPRWCAVEHCRTGEVYLEGELERGIVPAQSVWTHGGGGGEDGCLLLLHKMNLELLQRCAVFCVLKLALLQTQVSLVLRRARVQEWCHCPS